MQNARRARERRVRQIGLHLPLMLGCVLAGSYVPAQAASSVTALVDAARADDLSSVRTLIEERVGVNTPATDGSSALLWAAYHSNTEMAKDLLAAGAVVDAANRYGVTPLLQASRNGDVEMMRMLLDAGADPTRWHPEGETLLMAAARTGSVDAVQMLLSRGAFIDAVDPFQKQTALMWASSEGHVDVVKTLLAAGADPNLQAHVTPLTQRRNVDHPSGGFTALMFAVRNGHSDVARALIEGGADPTLTNADGATATVIAVVNDRFDLAKELLDLGADPNDGALFFAVDMHDATTDMRAHDGSRLQPDNPNNLTALGLVKSLLDLGADVNKPFVGALHSSTLCCAASVKSSPFYRAATAADVDVLKLLLDHGAELEWSPSEIPTDGKAPAGGGRGGAASQTPLMVAMRGGRGASFAAGPGFVRLVPPPFREPGNREPIDAIRVLLEAGADPNAKTSDGSTPLHLAVQEQQVEIIQALAAAGASLEAVDKDNLTPLGLADKIMRAPVPPPAANDDGAYRPERDSKEDVVAALRKLMNLGPNDPVPQPPPAAPAGEKVSDGAGQDEKLQAAAEASAQ